MLGNRHGESQGGFRSTPAEEVSWSRAAGPFTWGRRGVAFGGKCAATASQDAAVSFMQQGSQR
jgi:hypothetical protein